MTKDSILANLQVVIDEKSQTIQQNLTKRMDKMSTILIKAMHMGKKARYQNSFLQQSRNQRGLDNQGNLVELDQYDLAILRTDEISRAIDKWMDRAKARIGPNVARNPGKDVYPESRRGSIEEANEENVSIQSQELHQGDKSPLNKKPFFKHFKEANS